MRKYALLLAGLAVLACLPQRLHAAASHRHFVALAARDSVALFSKPAAGSRLLARLVQQTQVEVDAVHGQWYKVTAWASIHGWMHAKDLVKSKPWVSVSTYHAPVSRAATHARPSMPITAQAVVLAPLSILSRPSGVDRGQIKPGATIVVRAWQQDALGKIWYQVSSGWVMGDAVRFSSSARPVRSGLWQRVAGKGMWLTLGSVTDISPSVLVQAAVRNGVTHIYVESAISPLGFHGRDSVGPLIEAAHRSHLAVVAWVYPYLDDVGADIALSREVAAFTTPHGQKFDGMALDLERNMHVWDIRAFSQILRWYLGRRYLLVGVTYPPESIPDYPFADVGRQYDVIAPMDYWHQTKGPTGLDFGHMAYGREYGYRYAVDSIARIRQEAGNVPIAPIGQAFDDFGRLEMGPFAPSGAEIAGFLQGCKQSGAIGASFFQWMTVTDEEWKVIRGFRFTRQGSGQS